MNKKGDPISVPGWLPPVLYASVTLLLFREFVFTGQMLVGQDTLSLGFVARAFFADALRGGVFPLWNPYILGGTPFLDSLAGGDSLYPTSLLLLVMEPYRALGWKLVIHVFLAGLFTFGWIRALGLSRPAALIAGLAYLLAPHMVTLVYPGHDGKLFVSALTPLLFWVVELALARGRLAHLAAMSAVIGLVIFTTHFQQAYFLFGAVGIYAAVRSVVLWRGVDGSGLPLALRRFGLFLVFSLVGAGVAAIQLVPAVGYVLDSSRRTATTTQATEEGSVAYSSSWSMHPEEAMAMVVPEFVGNSQGDADWAQGTYWGRNAFKLNHEYAGLVVLLLAALSFLGAPRRAVRWTMSGIGIMALLYTLGAHTPVWRIFYEVVPGISLFRAPSIAAFLFGFGAVTLLAFGVDRVLTGGALRADVRLLAIATGVLGLGFLLASSGTLTEVWTGLLYTDISEGRAEALARATPFITRGFLLATILAGVVLALTWALKAGKLSPVLWLTGMGVVVAGDLVRVDDPFIQTMDFQEWAAPDPNFRFLAERQAEAAEPFRVLDMGGRVGVGQRVQGGFYSLEQAAGHHPNDLARYRELIGMVGSGVPGNLFIAEPPGPNLPLLSALNVRYVLWPAFQFGPLPGLEPVMGTSLGEGRPYELVYELPTLPRARLLGNAVVLSEEETVAYLRSSEFNPASEVVLNQEPPMTLGGSQVAGEVEWVSRELNSSRLRVRSDGPALLVMADNWYPAWKARVDGAEREVLRANHTLRAVPVEAGEHEVEVYFDKGTLALPLWISILSLVVIVVLAGLGLRGQRAGLAETPPA